jgi:hypothetical protein
MRGVKLVLAVGLGATLAAVFLLLLRSPLVLAGTNSVAADSGAEFEHGNFTGCQSVGAIPVGTSALRIAVEARAVGPEVSVRILSGGSVVSEGRLPTGWGSAPRATVPIESLSHAVNDGRVCTSFGPAVEPFRLHGTHTTAPLRLSGRPRTLALRIEYLRPGDKSWLSLASSTAHHMGLGRAAGGTWIVFLALALMLAVAVLASRLASRELR